VKGVSAIFLIIIISLSLVTPQASAHEIALGYKPPKVISFSLETMRDGISFTLALDASAQVILEIYTTSGVLVGKDVAHAYPGSAVKVSAKASDGDGDHIVFLRIKTEDGAFLRMRALIDLPGIFDPPDFPPLVDIRHFDVSLSGDHVYFLALPLTDIVSPYPDFPAYYIVKYDGSVIDSGSLSGYSSFIPSHKVPAEPGRHEYFVRVEDSDSNHYRVEYIYRFYIDAPPELTVDYSVESHGDNVSIVLHVLVQDDENDITVRVFLNGTQVYVGTARPGITTTITLYVVPGVYKVLVIAIDPFGLNATESFIVEATGGQEPQHGEDSSGSSSSSLSDTLSSLESIVSMLVVLVFLAIVYKMFFNEE